MIIILIDGILHWLRALLDWDGLISQFGQLQNSLSMGFQEAGVPAHSGGEPLSRISQNT